MPISSSNDENPSTKYSKELLAWLKHQPRHVQFHYWLIGQGPWPTANPLPKIPSPINHRSGENSAGRSYPKGTWCQECKKEYNEDEVWFIENGEHYRVECSQGHLIDED